jgi:parallel beta-helix repeat protein
MGNRSTLFSIIALIFGATALGLGAFLIINPNLIEGPQGMDGDDAPGYYCNSRAEFQQTLDSIGSAFGIIIINKSFVLDETIQIDGGGSYIIQGQGAGTILTCESDFEAIEITNAKFCTIEDLYIDSSNIVSSTQIIRVDEISNNPVYIEKTQIIGDNDLDGLGIYVRSENVKVSDCYITGVMLGINVHGSSNTIVNNFITNSQYGIQIEGSNSAIEDNTLYMLEYNGISMLSFLSGCKNNIISRNFITDFGFQGIYSVGCNFTLISENKISSFGLNGINLINCTSNVLSRNQISDVRDDGIDIRNGKYNLITGNLIINIIRNDTVSFGGLTLWDDSDFNTITGNGIYNCINYGTGTGYGIRILSSSSEENTVIGNTALNNDVNWLDGGTDTFGDSTNNNFS